VIKEGTGQDAIRTKLRIVNDGNVRDNRLREYAIKIASIFLQCVRKVAVRCVDLVVSIEVAVEVCCCFTVLSS
jgi:hypothetical protein